MKVTLNKKTRVIEEAIQVEIPEYKAFEYSLKYILIHPNKEDFRAVIIPLFTNSIKLITYPLDQLYRVNDPFFEVCIKAIEANKQIPIEKFDNHFRNVLNEINHVRINTD